MEQTEVFKISSIIALVFFLAGCATTNKTTSELKEEQAFTGSTLAVTGKLRFDDLPVPVGFKLAEDESFIFQSEGTRVALLKYSGRASFHDIVEFYREQMLLYNWQLLNIVEYGKSILNFERGRQSCIVSVEPKGMKKVITISVAPKVELGLDNKSKNK